MSWRNISFNVIWKRTPIQNSAVAQRVRLHPRGPGIEPRFGRDAILKPVKSLKNSWLLSSHTIRYTRVGSLNSLKLYPWEDQRLKGKNSLRDEGKAAELTFFLCNWFAQPNLGLLWQNWLTRYWVESELEKVN